MSRNLQNVFVFVHTSVMPIRWLLIQWQMLAGQMFGFADDLFGKNMYGKFKSVFTQRNQHSEPHQGDRLNFESIKGVEVRDKPLHIWRFTCLFDDACMEDCMLNRVCVTDYQLANNMAVFVLGAFIVRGIWGLSCRVAYNCT